LLERIAIWLENIAQPCFYKTLLGAECPGCGMQRSFIELLRGNFIDSILLYPALFTSILLIVLLPVHLLIKLQHGAAMLKYIFILNALIMVFHYIYKLLTY
jgi:hypothetical protein